MINHTADRQPIERKCVCVCVCEREREREREMLVASGFCRAQHYFTQDWIGVCVWVCVCVFSIPWSVYSAAPCLLCVKPPTYIITHHVSLPAAGRAEDSGSPRGQVGHRDGRGAAAFQAMTRTHRAGRMALTSREMLCLIGTACLWLPLFAEVRTPCLIMMMMMMMMMGLILQCGLIF